MTTSEPTSPRASYEATVDQLVADLGPVTRLRPMRTRFGVWLAVMLAMLAVALGVPRADLAERLGAIRFVGEITALAAVSAWLAWLALRSAEPDRTPARSERRLGWVLLSLVLAFAAAQPWATEVPIDDLLSIGGPCAWATLKFAIVPALVLFVAVRRGAAVEPTAAGALAGGAGFVLAYLAMRLHCSVEEALHLLSAHVVPVVAGTVGGAFIGGRRLGRWRRGPARV